MRGKLVLLSATTFGLLLPLAPAVAQDQAGADDGEIIVTARKRQESILEVPVITTVLSEAQLERSQVQDVTDIASKTPGLMLGVGPLEVGTQISMRGIGTNSMDPGIDQSVSLNLDGLQMTQGSAYSVGVFDMAQVEVLKGPQALFFGKASPAGVVSIRTKDPGDELEVIGRTGYEFEAREWRSEAIISGPLSDTFGVRLSTLYSHLGGFFKNVATPNEALGGVDPSDRFGKTKTLFIRGTAVFKPSSDFNARLKLNYTKDKNEDSQPWQLAGCPDGLVNYAGVQFYAINEDCKGDRKVALVAMSPAAYPGDPSLNFPVIPNGGVPFTNIRQYFGSLEMNYDIVPNLTLTSVTGYYNLRVFSMINATNSGFSPPAFQANKLLHRKEFTQEFRLNSDFEGPLNFTLGGFYQDGTITNRIQIGGNVLMLGPGGAVIYNGTHDVSIKALSFFGQARFKASPEFEIAAGARWTHEKRSDDAQTFLGLVDIAPTLPKLNSSNWSPELTLTYTPTDDLTIFGSLKQAYKSGSYNLIVPVFPGQDNSFGDEKVQGGEVGLKARLADRQVTTNLAFYYYKFKGMQVGINEAVPAGPPLFRTVNAGSAKVYGIDFDVTYRPRSAPGLSLNAGANWNHGRFTSFPNAPCWGGQTIAEGCDSLLAPVPAGDLFPQISIPDPVTGVPSRYTSQDLSGLRLLRAPAIQAVAGFDYEMPVGDDMTLNFGVDGQYSSKYLANLGINRPDYMQPDFFKINANVALKGPDEGWEVAFIANNITNKITTGNCINSNYAGSSIFPGVVSGAPVKGPGGSDELQCVFDRGRELWVRLTLRPVSLFGRGEESAPPPAPPPPPATQTCPDGSVIAADSMCPTPPPPPPEPQPDLRAGERG